MPESPPLAAHGRGARRQHSEPGSHACAGAGVSTLNALVYCGPAALIAVMLLVTVVLPNVVDLSSTAVRVLYVTAGVVTVLAMTVTFLVAYGGPPTTQQDEVPTTQQDEVMHSPSERGEVVNALANVSRRLQSLAGQQIGLLDELEDMTEDPVQLKGLFVVDHLANRMRREAESIAVLGGATSWRVWQEPVEMWEVLRSANAATKDYQRVKLVPPIEGRLAGVAVADVIHLIAALIENATRWGSTNDTEVEIRASVIPNGLAIQIDDRGAGIDPIKRQRLNEVLRDPGRLDAVEQLKDGRIGLLVVATLARRRNISVELQTNVFGGTRAVVVLPRSLLDAAPQARSRLQVARASGDRAVPERSNRGQATAGSTHTPGPPRPPADADGEAGRASGSRQAPTGGRPALPRRSPQRNAAEQPHTRARERPTQRPDEDANAFTTSLAADLRAGYRQAAQEDTQHQS